MKKKLLTFAVALFSLSFLATGCVIESNDDGYCGDGVCQVDYEDTANCPEDCSVSYTCGNGICEVYNGENDGNCYQDCNATYICDDFDYWLGTCYPACTVNWDCEAGYNSYGDADRDDLAFCATCLADDAEEHICDAGCQTSLGTSCESFVDNLIGLDCYKK